MSTRRTDKPIAPSAIAADHRLRSEFMRRLILSDAGRPTHQGTPPRLVVQFWHEETQRPADVQACLDSWAPLEESRFRRLLFDDATAAQFIQFNFSERHLLAFGSCEHPAMRADYFRLCFMVKVGGLYIDADDRYLGLAIDEAVGDARLRMQALCYDIPSDSMLDPYEAAKAGEDATRVFYVNNNPLIAPPGHPLLVRALERATDQVLLFQPSGRDIQAMTGPGNLTACLVEHALELDARGGDLDFALLPNWDAIAVSAWPLDYRADDRNWRIWVRGNG